MECGDSAPPLRPIPKKMPTESPTIALRDWPHSPAHRLGAPGAYIITSGTHLKQHLFSSRARLTLLTNSLLALAEKYDCALQAWAIFPNHYHFVAEVPHAQSLKRLVEHLHADTARHINRLDGVSGRKIWFQFWDTHLTYPRSYLARLSYVHSNAVRHGLVRRAEQYPWCSAGWFRRRAETAFYRTVMEFPCDQVFVPDDFGVASGAIDASTGDRLGRAYAVKAAPSRRTPYGCA